MQARSVQVAEEMQVHKISSAFDTSLTFANAVYLLHAWRPL